MNPILSTVDTKVKIDFSKIVPEPSTDMFDIICNFIVDNKNLTNQIVQEGNELYFKNITFKYKNTKYLLVNQDGVYDMWDYSSKDYIVHNISDVCDIVGIK